MEGRGVENVQILWTNSTDRLHEMRIRKGRGSKIPKILRTSFMNGPYVRREQQEGGKDLLYSVYSNVVLCSRRVLLCRYPSHAFCSSLNDGEFRSGQMMSEFIHSQ